jgi:hypothetical protein
MINARLFVSYLQDLQSDEELRKIRRYFKSGEGEYGQGDTFMGVRMGSVFDLANEFVDMDLDEVEKLLESNWHEARAGAVAIMDFKARNKRTDKLDRPQWDYYLNLGKSK